jgi:RNA polymerase primary sigma factor
MNQEPAKQLRRQPISEEIAARLGISVGKVPALMPTAQETVSLDMPVGGEEGFRWEDPIENKTATGPVG